MDAADHQASTWVAISISVVAVAISVIGLLRDNRHYKQTRKEQAYLRAEQERQALAAHRQAVLVKVRKLIDKWRNSILSDQYAVKDDNWSGLLQRSMEWRRALADETEEILRHTHGERVRAYVLLMRTIPAAKDFETSIRPVSRRS